MGPPGRPRKQGGNGHWSAGFRSSSFIGSDFRSGLACKQQPDVSTARRCNTLTHQRVVSYMQAGALASSPTPIVTFQRLRMNHDVEEEEPMPNIYLGK